MPVVPVARTRVTPEGLPNARVTVGAPEGAFGGPSLEGVSRVAQSIAYEQRQAADQVQHLDDDNQLGALERRLTTQVTAAKGKDALQAASDAADEWEAVTSEMAARKGERQRPGFDALKANRGERLRAEAERHAARETEQYDIDTTEGAIANRINDAAVGYRDPARVAQALAEQTAILKDFGRRHGIAPEKLKQKIDDQTSKLHMGVLSQMLADDNDLAATKYFSDHQGELQADDQVKIKGALEQGSTMGEGQRQADQIIATKGVTRTDAFEAARKITNPKVRQETERRLDVEFSRRDRAERDEYEASHERALGFVEQGRMPPASVMATLKAADRISIRNLLKSKAKDEPIKTDQATLYGLILAAGAPDEKTRKEFANTNLLSYRDKLSSSDFEQMARTQASLRKGDAAPDDVQGIVTTSQAVRSAIKSSGVKPGSDEEVAVLSAANNAVIEAQKATGKKHLTADETQDIIARTVVKHFYIDKPGLDPAKRGSELTTDERGRAYVPVAKIPGADLERIKQEMARRGRAYDQRAAERAYAASLLGDRDLFDDIVSGPTYMGPR